MMGRMARRFVLTCALLALGCLPLRVDASGDPLRELEAMVRAGRDEAALVKIAEADPEFRRRPEIRYLTARLLSRIGEDVRALDALPPIDSLPEGVRDDVALERALLQSKVGDCASALPLLVEHAGRDGGRRDLARFRATACAHALGRHQEVLTLSRETLERDPAGVDLLEVRLLRADAELALGRKKRAIEELRTAWIERPSHPKIPEVEARLRRIPGGAARLDAEARAARVASLVEARRFTAALEALATLPPAERRKPEARRWEGRALYALKRYGEAARLLSATARGKGPEARRDELLAARARYRAGDKAAGLRELRRIAQKHLNTPEGDLAAYLLAEVSYDRGGPAGKAALERFLASPAARRLDREAQSARFRMGIEAFEAERGKDAATQFAAYRRAALDREQRLAGAYWEARALALQGKNEEAIAAFAQLAEEHPFDWYGYHARRRLHAMGEARRIEPSLPPPLPEMVLPAATREESEAARFYRRLGLVSDAEAKLREALSDDPHERLAFHLARADVRSAYLTARSDRALHRPVDALTRWIWEAAYPRPHRALITSVAERAGIPEAWVYATMRQESGFHADARSRSGAEGLLQIMPSAAAGAAAAAGVDLAAASLLEPEVNVTLGVEMMRRLGERLNGQLPLMAAAYNAGRARLLSWLNEHGDAELDLFVERVPYDETRRYIKRVVSHYFVYRYLDGEPDPFEGAIPEKVERR
jgi:soluble lytic murein transglycosylase